MRSQFVLMSAYNAWMNSKLYQAAARLPADELTFDRGAFFGSIFSTLNHIVVADRIWLSRFAVHPSHYAALESVRVMPVPVALGDFLFRNFEQLAAHRRMLDAVITQWVSALADDDMHQVLHYRNVRGLAKEKRFSSLLLHFFNHQTHHRGQVTTLLSQAGIDVGVTDLLDLIADE